MIKTPKYIQIIKTTQPGLSSMSNKSCDSIYYELSQIYSKVEVHVVNDVSQIHNLVKKKPDLVFLGFGHLANNPSLGRLDLNKIAITNILDSNNISYTGSSSKALKLTSLKHEAKKVIRLAGLNTSNYYVTNNTINKNINLNYPLFVKPADRGGGLGINPESYVTNLLELTNKISTLSKIHNSHSLIEEYLPGREFSVAVIQDLYSTNCNAYPIELIANKDTRGNRMLSGQIKSANSEKVLKVTNKILYNNLTSLALSSFTTLGAKGYGRIDIRLDKNGHANFLEANLLPCLIEDYGSFPKACLINNEMSFSQTLSQIVEISLQNNLNYSSFNYSNEHTMQPALI